ncbi:MAG: hypothetical protein O3A00_22175 [Planctomycetota bacterium]|nr:hypothetical protein [Planctomycetota bacterium]
MSTIVIPCPKCGRELRLSNPKLLGRRGKCPKCAHRFILEEPEDEVSLELADAVAVPASAPAVGTSARWVSDKPSPQAATATATATEVAPAVGFAFDAVAAAPAPGTGGVDRLKELRRKNAKQRNMMIIAMVAVGVIGLAGFWALGGFDKPEIVQTEKKSPKRFKTLEDKKAQLKENVAVASELRPTRGKPIALKYATMGTRMVVHLRPAEIWGDEAKMQNFIASTGPFGEWMKAAVREYCEHDPKDVLEATFCFLMEQKGQPPSITVIARLKGLIDKGAFVIGKPRKEDLEYTYYESGNRVYLLAAEKDEAGQDSTILVVGPKAYVVDMVQGALGNPQLPADDIYELLPMTDRDRHFTLMLIPDDIFIHQETLIHKNARASVDALLAELVNDVQSLSWSVHLGEKFHSELYFRNKNKTTVSNLEDILQDVFDDAPERILAAVRYMQPPTVGEKKLIGRFPVMTQAFSMATMMGVGTRFVQATTILPAKAGPNIALGTLLTLNQAALTDFTKEAPKPVDSNLPTTVAGRLQLPVLIEFARTPLQEAFAYIAEEAKLTIEIDGDALKGGGYTKNMAQTFNLGTKPAIEGIAKILSQYQAPDKPEQQMCIIIDETKKVVTVMTQKVAADRKLTPHPFKF